MKRPINLIGLFEFVSKKNNKKWLTNRVRVVNILKTERTLFLRAEKKQRELSEYTYWRGFMRKQVFSLLVNNNAGVLSRVAGLFSRRGYSIDSITSGITMNKRVSRITVVASGDEQILTQIKKQLAKIEDVLDIKILVDGQSVCRELILVKVKANASQRTEVVAVADIFRAKIVDVETDSLMMEMTGTQSKVEAFLDLLSTYEILELARTGITGLSRGSKDVKMFEDD